MVSREWRPIADRLWRRMRAVRDRLRLAANRYGIPMRIAVVGKGVIGLSCGLTLARDGHTVTILSRPSDREVVRTSMVAGGVLVPVSHDDRSGREVRRSRSRRPTLDHFLKLAGSRRFRLVSSTPSSTSASPCRSPIAGGIAGPRFASDPCRPRRSRRFPNSAC